MPEILIAVSNKIPVVVGDTKCIVADNSDYIVRFSFDGQWQDGEKTVYFVRDNGFAYPPVRTESDAVPVPRQETGGINKRLYIGVTQGESRTTRPAGINVLSSITDMIDDSAVQPDPSMWESVLKRLARLEAGGGSGGGVSFVLGETLELDNGVLNVKTTNAAERDNTLPITSSGVYTIVGNIGAVLDTI